VEYQVILSRPAWRDLKQIEKYITQDNPEAAKTFCAKLLLEAKTLKTFPDRGQRVVGNAARCIPYRSYIIFYQIDSSRNQVHILRFWHASRNQKQLRLKEEEPDYGEKTLLQQTQAQQ
jgi:addiction module RelE/StbE family toxin